MGHFPGVWVPLVVGIAAAQTPIQLTNIASGLSQPTHIANAGDGSGRLLVVEQAGRIRVIANGAVLPNAFLDISGHVSCCGERGLLSVAFPPGQPKPEFFVYYTDPAGDITVSRFLVNSARDAGDPASETVILKINHQQYPNHNGGQLAFGPDGFLYLGTGDGGSGGDPLGNGQNTNALLGKLLRIDVEGGTSPYGIPPDNPFVNQTGSRPEIWAYGLRNPWRFSFDRATGDLFIGDVGQNLYEEVDMQSAGTAGGRNYGWNIMEGFHCYQSGCSMTGLTLPVAEYDHSLGDCAVVGGFVYRGSQFPTLQGTYYYADDCTGHVWGLTQTGGLWTSTLLLSSGLSISTFGQDEAGELYLADQAKGDIYHLTAAAATNRITAVVDAASFATGIVPGSLATAFGVGITSVTGIVNASATPLGTTLGSASLLVNGAPVPLLAVANVNGREQINFQVPWDLASHGNANITVTNGTATIVPALAQIVPAHPALFTVDGIHAAAQHADYRPVSASDPVTAGELILLYGTGFGPVSNPPATGAAAPLSPLSMTTVLPTVSIGGTNAPLDFAGLTPLAVGLYQLNVHIPSGLTAGEADVVASVSSTVGATVKLYMK